MRGALNTYQANGRRYFRRSLASSSSMRLTGSLVAARIIALIGAATVRLSATLAAVRARTMPMSASLRLTATLKGDFIRIPERVEFMRRPAGNRSFRRPPQTRVMRGEKST